MPILSHVFKKKDKRKERIQEPRQKHAPKKIEKLEPKTPAKPKSTTGKKQKRKGSSTTIKSEFAHAAYNIILRPHISEKSVSRTDAGEYVFEVYDGKNVKQIADAIEAVYGVKVEKVRRIGVKGKKKRYRLQKGVSSRYDKAVVKLKEGQEIEVMPQ